MGKTKYQVILLPVVTLCECVLDIQRDALEETCMTAVPYIVLKHWVRLSVDGGSLKESPECNIYTQAGLSGERSIKEPSSVS